MKHLLSLLSVCFVLFSCSQEGQQKKSLSQESFLFGENLSSVSQGEGMLWIGTENSQAYLFDGQLSKKYDLSTSGLIYNILPYIDPKGDTTLFVGVRNAGLSTYTISKGRASLVKTYTLDLVDKQYNYSPYDFKLVSDTLYIGTSNGFYKKNINQPDSILEPLYPSSERLQTDPEFGCRSVQVLDNGDIVASCIDGVLIYSPHSGLTKTYLQGHPVSSVAEHRDTVFAVSRDFLFTITNDKIDSISCVNSPEVYFEDLNHNKWLIASGSVRIGRELKDMFKEMDLCNDITLATKGRNIISTDPEGYFTYLITKNSLWKIPKNLNIYDQQMDVRATTTDEYGDTYIVCGNNKLYLKKKNSDKATFIAIINIPAEIQWIATFAHRLYLHTGKTAYTMAVPRNSLSGYSAKAIFEANDIFAAHMHRTDTTLYLGNRDGLYLIDKYNKIDTIPSLKKKYVTSIFHNREPHNPDHIYLSTLSNGVYQSIGKTHTWFDNPITKPIFIDHKDIESVIASKDWHLILTTDQRLISNSTSIKTKNQNSKKLIYVNDSTFYTVRDKGLDRYNIRKDSITYQASYFKDIEFSANACFMADDSTMVLGGKIGVFSINPLCVPSMNDSIDWLAFDKPHSIEEHLSDIVIYALLIVMIGGGYFLYRRAGKTKKDHMLVSQKKQISNIIEEFKSILPIFDPMGQQSQQLRSLISQTGEIGSSSYSLKELDGIYKRVTEFYSHIILQIPDIIDNQIKTLSQVSNPCAKALLQSSISVKQQKSFQLLKNQALENFKWLSQYHQLKESLHQDCQKLKDCSQVEGVNKGLHNRIDIILNTLIGTGDITLCQEKYQHISTQIEAIDKPESRQRISKYLHCLKEYFDQKSQVSIIYRPILEYIQQSIEASQDDNFQLLRQLAYIEYQIDILSQMDHIKDLCQQEPLDSYAKSIQTKINDLYRSLNSQDRDIISKVLNIDNPQAQAPQVLVLLLADKKIKSSKLPVILGVYSNLNAVKSRLLAELKSKAAFLEDYQRDQGKSSVVLIHLLSILA